MNKYEKAIDYLRGLQKTNELFLAYANNSNDQILMRQAESAINNINTSIMALEKQVLKPPEHKVHEKYKELGKNYYCECGVMFVDFERNGTNFCGNCGQRLKENK